MSCRGSLFFLLPYSPLYLSLECGFSVLNLFPNFGITNKDVVECFGPFGLRKRQGAWPLEEATCG